MSYWNQLKVPPFCERLFALTVPSDKQLVVLSYEGAHRIHLTEPVRAEDCEFDPDETFDPERRILSVEGQDHPTIGLYGNQAAITTFGNESLVVDSESETLTVLSDHVAPFSFKYENFSGDWVVATFSRDGQHIILACPYDFDFVVLRRAAANAEQPPGN